MALMTETRDVSGFSEIAIQGFGDATLIQGDEEGLVVEADESIIARIRSEVRGGRLVLGLDLAWWEWPTWWFTWLFAPNKQACYTIRLRDFKGASISGSGKIMAGALSGSTCRFDVSGSGKVVIDHLTADVVDTHVSGSGDITMAGRVERQAIRISGSGFVKNSELETLDTDISISGSGKASVNATRTLGVDVSGSGSVFYRGQPHVNQHVSGSGRVGAAS
jgi:hypothetical protein